MAKSVYSLVLEDELITEVDRLAYSVNSNRSAMINRILADYFSFMTPEKKIRTIFQEVERLMETANGFRLQVLPSESMMSIQSALAYKYNPVIRYTLELYRENNTLLGEMRVGFRTQNQQLIAAFHHFLQIWVHLEQRAIGRHFQNTTVPCVVENGRYRRLFRAVPELGDTERLGKAIAQYIRMFDAVLKVYFSHMNHPDVLLYTEDAYRTCLKQLDFVI